MSTVEDKMYCIAKLYNYLNDKGKVKAKRCNEKGYAKIKDIVRGCSLFVHHMNDDQLIINLFVSTAAKTRYEILCNKAVDVFKKHFQSDVLCTSWENSLGGGYVYDRYIVDVTNKDLPVLLKMIEEVRDKLAGV